MWKIESVIPVNLDSDKPKTEITLTKENREIIRRQVFGDVRGESEASQIDLALKQFYADEFADKFQNEAIVELAQAKQESEQMTQVNSAMVARLNAAVGKLTLRVDSLEETTKKATEEASTVADNSEEV